MKFNNNIKTTALLLCMFSFGNANAFSLGDYFEDKPSDDLAQEEPQPVSQKSTPETYKLGRIGQFDQWRLQCVVAQSSGKEICNLVHQINSENNQQIIKIERIKDSKDEYLVFSLPLGSHLPAGAILIVGSTEYKMPITSCLPAGCRSQLTLDWNIDQQLKREEKATVQLIHSNQIQKINIGFSLMGFSKGSKEVL